MEKDENDITKTWGSFRNEDCSDESDGFESLNSGNDTGDCGLNVADVDSHHEKKLSGLI